MKKGTLAMLIGFCIFILGGVPVVNKLFFVFYDVNQLEDSLPLILTFTSVMILGIGLMIVAISLYLFSPTLKNMDDTVTLQLKDELNQFLDIFANGTNIKTFDYNSLFKSVKKGFFEEKDFEEKTGFHHDFYGVYERINVLHELCDSKPKVNAIISHIHSLHVKMNKNDIDYIDPMLDNNGNLKFFNNN